jgi:hypothetical protein
MVDLAALLSSESKGPPANDGVAPGFLQLALNK